MLNKPRSSKVVARKASVLLRRSTSSKAKSVAGGALGNRRKYA